MTSRGAGVLPYEVYSRSQFLVLMVPESRYIWPFFHILQTSGMKMSLNIDVI